MWGSDQGLEEQGQVFCFSPFSFGGFLEELSIQLGFVEQSQKCKGANIVLGEQITRWG